MLRLSSQLISLVLVCLASIQAAVATELCEAQASSPLAVSFIETERGKSRQIDFIRDNDQVVYIYHDLNVADQWQKGPGGRISLIRYFLKHDFAIGYTSSDLQTVNINLDWMRLYNWFSPEYLNAKPVQGARKCTNWQMYHARKPGWLFDLNWHTAWQLPVEYHAKSRRKEYALSLAETLPAEKLAHYQQIFANAEHMDFADIGDNETHPIVRSLIYFGFVPGHQH